MRRLTKMARTKIVVVAFVFLLTCLAMSWAHPATSLGTTQLTEDQKKLCLSCHSPRYLPTNLTEIHTGKYEMMATGAPCYLCHVGQDPNGGDVYLSTNVKHPDEKESKAIGKDLLECTECHYEHNIQQELATGESVKPPPPESNPPSSNSTTGGGSTVTHRGVSLEALIIQVIAGTSLITGVCLFAVLLPIRKQNLAKGGS
jgi:hypothetical protein